MDELKPCPFCGGSAIVDFKQNSKTLQVFAVVKCNMCNAMGHSFIVHRHENEENRTIAGYHAIEAWNRRTNG